MAIYVGGTEVTDVSIGSSSVKEVYVGSDLVFPVGAYMGPENNYSGKVWGARYGNNPPTFTYGLSASAGESTPHQRWTRTAGSGLAQWWWIEIDQTLLDIQAGKNYEITMRLTEASGWQGTAGITAGITTSASVSGLGSFITQSPALFPTTGIITEQTWQFAGTNHAALYWAMQCQNFDAAGATAGFYSIRWREV